MSRKYGHRHAAVITAHGASVDFLRPALRRHERLDRHGGQHHEIVAFKQPAHVTIESRALCARRHEFCCAQDLRLFIFPYRLRLKARGFSDSAVCRG